MSFKKPFRAKPLVLGEYAQAQKARKRRQALVRTVLKILAIANIVFAAGMIVTNPQLVSKHLPDGASYLISAEEPQKNDNFPYYPDCDAARAAGAAPIYRNTPGYRPELDSDHDGIACEPYIGM